MGSNIKIVVQSIRKSTKGWVVHEKDAKETPIFGIKIKDDPETKYKRGIRSSQSNEVIKVIIHKYHAFKYIIKRSTIICEGWSWIWEVLPLHHLSSI